MVVRITESEKYQVELDQFGKGGQLELTIEVWATFWKGEPRTWEYPGSADHFILDHWTVERITDHYNYDLTRDDRPDWFSWIENAESVIQAIETYLIRNHNDSF